MKIDFIFEARAAEDNWPEKEDWLTQNWDILKNKRRKNEFGSFYRQQNF
jgi:hypothetical protein